MQHLRNFENILRKIAIIITLYDELETRLSYALKLRYLTADLSFRLVICKERGTR